MHSSYCVQRILMITKDIPKEQWGKLLPFYERYKSVAIYNELVERASKCILILGASNSVGGCFFVKEEISEISPNITKMKTPFPVKAEAKLLDILLHPSTEPKDACIAINGALRSRYESIIYYVPSDAKNVNYKHFHTVTSNYFSKEILKHKDGTIYRAST